MADTISRIARDVRETLQTFYPGSDCETHYAASESIANELAERGYVDCGWRPMSEAPRDGTPVLAYNAVENEMTTIFWEAALSRWRLCDPGEYPEDIEFDPTHWRPLPPTPADQNSGGGDG